jgi:predicted RNA-binding Zn ribbon-like protein
MPSASDHDRLAALDLLGGDPALDFVNSIDPRGGPEPPVDHIRGYHELTRWAAYAAVLSDERAERLIPAANRDQRAADRVWRRTIALREALYRVLEALVAGGLADEADLAIIDAERTRAEAHTELTPTHGPAAHGPAFEIAPTDTADLEAPLRELARASAALLTRADPSRLRICPVEDGGCGWVILDQTRNGSRRWCSMSSCGNHAKATRLTERRRRARAGRGRR